MNIDPARGEADYAGGGGDGGVWWHWRGTMKNSGRTKEDGRAGF